MVGTSKDSAWGMGLHDAEPAPSKLKDTNTGGNTPSLSQTSSVTMVSTLESNLNTKIQEANARRKEDAETTKRALQQIEVRVEEQHSEVTRRLTDHDTGLTLLHEGQMHLELNLKMLMTKMGVTPQNADASLKPRDEQTVQTTAATVAIGGVQDDKVGRDLDGDFQMTVEDFDKVLEDCSRVRELRPQGTKKQKVASPSDNSRAGDDPDL